MSALDRRTLIAAGLMGAATPALAQDYPPAQNRTGGGAPSAFDANGNPIDPYAPTRRDAYGGQDQAPNQAPNQGQYQGQYQGRDSDVGPPSPGPTPMYPAGQKADTYDRGEIVNGASNFLGVTAEAAGAAVERIFAQNGRPTAYIAGEELSAAFIGGLRYGKGLLYMKRRPPLRVYWQGPSAGWDFGANGSRCFTLCYNLQYPDAIFRRFPGVEGSAYFIGGVGVNYQRADEIDLAPMRAGVGLRLGANVGYLAYSRQRNWFPF